MIAASYARRSDSKGKRRDERSVSEQEELNVREAEKNGWKLPTNHLFRDNDISASRYSKKERPDWLRFNKELESGTVDVIMLWEVSRAWRKMREWTELVYKCEEKNIFIHVTSDRRTYDPRDDRDWLSLMEDGLDSERESRKISKRVRRAFEANREQGKPHGIPPYGYAIQVDPTNPREVVRVVVPERAKIVEEIITRVAHSETKTSIIRDLNARNIPSPGGGIWRINTLTRICTNKAYLGLLTYMGMNVEATWPAIIHDEELFYRAYNIISARKGTRPEGAHYMLSFFATCDVCGSYHARKGGSNKAPRYQCSSPSACTTIRLEWLDLFISELVCARLARPDAFDAITKKDMDKKPLRLELERLKAEHKEALELRQGGKLSLLALSQEEERILPRIQEIERLLEPAPLPQVIQDLRGDNVATIRARWRNLTVAAQKDVIRILFKSIRIGKSTFIGRVPKGKEDEILRERVKIEWA